MTKKQKKWLIRIIVSLVLFIILFITDHLIDLETIIPNVNSIYIKLIPYVIVYIIIGYDVILKAIRNIINGQIFDENFLMLIATIGAFIITEFDEAVAVLLFYQVGEFFQNYAVSSSRKSIASLMDIRPDYANIYKDGELVEVMPDEVEVGQVIVVKPGEKIPLDGVIIKGTTSVDMKALTGESMPVDLKVGSDVISGSINLLSLIEVKVTKKFYDSTVSKILDLVENAQSKKSKSENFITKFAKYYTPIVVILAILLAVIPSLITKDWSTWVYRSLNFLVVSCPCAIVISVPLSFFSGLGKASKNGILVKGSNYIEKMAKANIFILDKTGTLTKGNFKVTRIHAVKSESEVLKSAAICEKNSNHPIAISIMEEYNRIFKDIDVENYEIIDRAGYGIKATKDDDVIVVGNEKFMIEEKISYIHLEEAGTICYVSKNGEYLGAIVISDEIKNESFEFISNLNKMNLKSIMLTGDNKLVASDVCSTLGITEFHSSLLPQDKVSIVEDVMNTKLEKDIVCYIGDGINDAPVLTRSDVGISMGQIGSDAAIEASDIVLMNDDLRGIIKIKKIAQKTVKVVKQNIVFALGVKVLVLILSAVGLTNMWVSVFADVGVAIIAILNAMRVSK